MLLFYYIYGIIAEKSRLKKLNISNDLDRSLWLMENMSRIAAAHVVTIIVPKKVTIIVPKKVIV